jgi:hypothetical protein
MNMLFHHIFNIDCDQCLQFHMKKPNQTPSLMMDDTNACTHLRLLRCAVGLLESSVHANMHGVEYMYMYLRRLHVQTTSARSDGNEPNRTNQTTEIRQLASTSPFYGPGRVRAVEAPRGCHLYHPETWQYLKARPRWHPLR